MSKHQVLNAVVVAAMMLNLFSVPVFAAPPSAPPAMPVAAPARPAPNAAWLPGWPNRTRVTINNPGAALTDYQAQVDLDSSFPFAQAKADGSDLRVTAADETTLLPFWIESWNQASTIATVFVKLSSLPSGPTTIYLYYGNPGATSASNAAGVFDL